MRMCLRHLVPIKYAQHIGNAEIIENSNRTGSFGPSYAAPIATRAIVSVPTGEAAQHMFGVALDYDKTVILQNPCQITESSVLWIDDLIKDKHDYVVVCVARTLSYTQIAARRVSVS